MIDHKCAIYWDGDKPEILFVFDNLDAADKELERHQLSTEEKMESWKNESKAAIEKGELFRGGGILVLSELMRKHSKIVSLRAAMKHWAK
jgi:hypothetical protein